ncbi:MAG: hypothetical protein ABIY55_11535 [Kofleriaceae bacterium]
MIELTSKEVTRSWTMPYNSARGFVLSAVGEPTTLEQVYRAWTFARQHGHSLGLAKVIVRRRVIDLMRKDARPGHHCSLSDTSADTPYEPGIESFDEVVRRTPQTQLELRQLIQLVREAVECFATQGSVQRRQAKLLERYALDEASYAELSVELSCSEAALRVRVHKAMIALRRHIHECHVDLEDVLGRGRLRANAPPADLLANVLTLR